MRAFVIGEMRFLWVASLCLFFTWHFLLFLPLLRWRGWKGDQQSARGGGGRTLVFSVDGLISSYQASKWILLQQTMTDDGQKRCPCSEKNLSKKLRNTLRTLCSPPMGGVFFLHTIVNVYGEDGWFRTGARNRIRNVRIFSLMGCSPWGRYL